MNTAGDVKELMKQFQVAASPEGMTTKEFTSTWQFPGENVQNTNFPRMYFLDTAGNFVDIVSGIDHPHMTRFFKNVNHMKAGLYKALEECGAEVPDSAPSAAGRRARARA